MRITLKEFQSLITDGRKFSCVENTRRPQLNGQDRKIVKAQRNGWFWRTVNDPNDDGSRKWSDMPKASDIISSREIYTKGEPCGMQVTLSLGENTLTLEFEYENLPA